MLTHITKTKRKDGTVVKITSTLRDNATWKQKSVVCPRGCRYWRFEDEVHEQELAHALQDAIYSLGL